MLILPEFQRPYLLDNPSAPIVAKLFYSFSAAMLDYTLMPIHYLEETTGAAVNVRINEFEFAIPYNWYIMISDPDTLSLDFVPIHECATTKCFALLMTPADTQFRLAEIKILGINPEVSLVHPMITKNTAFCHPVGDITLGSGMKTVLNVMLTPFDLYKKVEGFLYGDII